MRDNVSKLIMDGMKLSLFKVDRIVFQSVVSLASNSKHIDSNANFTIAGGLAIERTSANCFFLIPLTAKYFGFIYCIVNGIKLFKNNPKEKIIN